MPKNVKKKFQLYRWNCQFLTRFLAKQTMICILGFKGF